MSLKQFRMFYYGAVFFGRHGFQSDIVFRYEFDVIR